MLDSTSSVTRSYLGIKNQLDVIMINEYKKISQILLTYSKYELLDVGCNAHVQPGSSSGGRGSMYVSKSRQQARGVVSCKIEPLRVIVPGDSCVFEVSEKP